VRSSGELSTNFGGGIGDSAIEELLADDGHAGRWHGIILTIPPRREI
jgi:hypothetical protein